MVQMQNENLQRKTTTIREVHKNGEKKKKKNYFTIPELWEDQ